MAKTDTKIKTKTKTKITVWALEAPKSIKDTKDLSRIKARKDKIAFKEGETTYEWEGDKTSSASAYATLADLKEYLTAIAAGMRAKAEDSLADIEAFEAYIQGLKD